MEKQPVNGLYNGYTVAILGLGYKFILKYRHNKYQLVRTISDVFQLGFAF
jgi:hypothetical protein